MYKSFHITNFNFNQNESLKNLISDDEIQDYKNKLTYKELLSSEDSPNNFIKKIHTYLLDKNNELDADKIMEKVFPHVEADVFLSHAHDNEDDVIRLALILEKHYGYKVFIDSLIWGNVFELLKAVDDSYCKKDDDNYSYSKRNYTTANVYMILNTALHHMINASDYFIFLETPESVVIKKLFNNRNECKYISSPWIYSEMFFATQVRRRDPKTELFFKNVLSVENFRGRDEDPFSFLHKLPKLDFTLTNQVFLKMIWDNV